MIIDVEPHGPYTTDPDFMDGCSRRFDDSPWLKMNFDTGNTFIAGATRSSSSSGFKHKVSHCHIKDPSASRWPRHCRGEEPESRPRGGHRRRRQRRQHRRLHRGAQVGQVGRHFSPSSASRPGNVEKSLEWLRKQIGSKREFAIGTRAARPRAANTHSAVGKHWRNHHV